MFLDAARPETVDTVSFDGPRHESADHPLPYKLWQAWEPTSISHHARECCEIAREWVASYDVSLLNGASPFTGPRWIVNRFKWGPVCYPIYWCEVLEKDELDCGVHAALAHEVFTGRDVKSFRVQLIQEYTKDAALQWHAVWSEEAAVTDWINENLIYHEACAVLLPSGNLKIWDPSAGWWIDSRATSGYGSPRAIRLTSSASNSGPFLWQHHRISPDRWTVLG